MILVVPGFRQASRFLMRAKTQKTTGHFFFSLATCGCERDFLKMLPKFKMAARGQLGNFLWAQKLRCTGDFFKVSLKFKIASTDQLQFFCGHKNSNN